MRPRVWAILAAGGALAVAGHAQAQDDGPRVYQLVPDGAQNFTVFVVNKRSNEEPEVGSVIPGADIDTDVAVFRYVRTFNVGGRAFSPFVIVPTGRVKSTINGVKNESSGFGDAQIGGTIGLIGSPALTPEAFAAFKPGFATGLLARVFFPTGAYNSDQSLNFGSNRYSFQLGLPSVFAWGSSYRDPSLTSLEVLPTLTFYGDNDEPFGAGKSAKDPLFSVEAHLTHNLNRTTWLSADLLYRQGGETTTDGVANHNAIHGLSGGATAAFTLSPTASVIFTYEEVLARNDNGPDGWFFRTALVFPF